MSDEQPTPQPLRFEQHVVLVVDEFPPLTVLTEAFLRKPHVYHASVKDDMVTFSIGNGEGVYRLRRDLDSVDGGILAELVEATPKQTMAQLRRKFDDNAARLVSQAQVR